MEATKAIASISDSNHEPTISNFTYSQDSISVASTETNALITSLVKSNNFILGFDCEVYSNADKDSIFSGMNTVNKDIYWQLTHNANASAPNVRYDFYAMYDAVFVCENGNMDVRF
jgi:methionine synthase I (cobalamin-dependent)